MNKQLHDLLKGVLNCGFAKIVWNIDDMQVTAYRADSIVPFVEEDYIWNLKTHKAFVRLNDYCEDEGLANTIWTEEDLKDATTE